MITLKKKPDQHMMERYGSATILRLALLKQEGPEKFEQLMPLVRCKDFICDVYWSSFGKTDINFYGMKWNGKKDSPDWEQVNLLVNFPNKEMQNFFMENLQHLWEIEGANGIPLTQVFTVDECNVVLLGNKKWLSNLLYLSLYVFLIRLMGVKPIATEDWIGELQEQTGTIDGKFLSTISKETLRKVFSELDLLASDKWCGFEIEEKTKYTIHHNSGFVSIFGFHDEMNPNNVKTNFHWQEAKQKGLELYTN